MTTHDAYLVEVDDETLTFGGPGGEFRVRGISSDELDGDVLLVVPERRIAHRLIRSSSLHNTLLVTEGCDQLCVMCSQPPKRQHVNYLSQIETAAMLAPEQAVLGISGGEPTLFKHELFDMFGRLLSVRSDLSFHVLTNAQHFGPEDLPRLSQSSGQVTWAVPLYSVDPSQHDKIVGKPGAHARLLESLDLLCRGGTLVELRTVMIRENVGDLPRIADFVTTHLPFIVRWAIMQLENIGYARRDWDKLFHDSSTEFASVGSAIDIAQARGVKALLYNFPLCTVPEGYRKYAPATISDWKRRYLPKCNGCVAQASCGGFFEWYPELRGFHRVQPI